MAACSGAEDDTRDWSVGNTVWHTGCYEPHVEMICRRLLHADSVAINVGANIGYHTFVLAGIARTVLAVEANPVTSSLLRCSLALNGFHSVSVIGHAVMDRPQAVEIFCPDEFLGAGAVTRPSWNDDRNLDHWHRCPVEAVTLDSVISDIAAVDVIRMDIEGYGGRGRCYALTGRANTLAASLSVDVRHHFQPLPRSLQIRLSILQEQVPWATDQRVKMGLRPRCLGPQPTNVFAHDSHAGQYRGSVGHQLHGHL
jgi:FkbM family methyltransferase